MMALTESRVSETTERFLRAIAERLAPDRVVEVHLFPPLRHGPIESAVAIVAVADDGRPVTTGSEPIAGVGDGLPTDPSPVLGHRSDGDAARHVIYTATYRHTRKGPDRGAWSVEIVAQADAPLDAVAAVVRGVHRRSDGAWAGIQPAPSDGLVDADRLSGAEFRTIVGSGSQPAADSGQQQDSPARGGP
jgi:hypothetical protein